MKILNYEYIQHNITNRPWGVECQFTVINDKGHQYDDIAMISSDKLDESEIVDAILDRLNQIDFVREESTPEKTFTEKEVESLLVSKGYLTTGQKIDSLKSSVEMVAAIKEVIE